MPIPTFHGEKGFTWQALVTQMPGCAQRYKPFIAEQCLIIVRKNRNFFTHLAAFKTHAGWA
jgi:hypothetical protein